MVKNIVAALFIAFVSLLVTDLALAANNLSIRVEQPKSPNNQSGFNVNFVVLDVLGRPIEVKCFRKGPGEAGFTQFGSALSLAAGGNTGNCQVTSDVVTGEGTYQFSATATAGAESVDSQVVSVEYKTSTPGTPGDYKRETQPSSCQFKISFKTADDGGKTSKVEIYRSDQTSFTADDGTRVGTVFAGSNQEGSFIDTVPDCAKTYYYAIRAFDGAGNGSGVVGDSVVKVVITTPATTTETQVVQAAAQGAIPVTTSIVGEVLGEQKEKGAGEILGESEATKSPAREGVKETPAGAFFTRENLSVGAIIIGILLAIYFYRRTRQS